MASATTGNVRTDDARDPRPRATGPAMEFAVERRGSPRMMTPARVPVDACGSHSRARSECRRPKGDRLRIDVPDSTFEKTPEAEHGGAEHLVLSSRDRLAALAALASELGAADAHADASALADRIAEGRFFVACVGEFKRGKSTLINALVERAVLPTGIVPVTAVPTVLRHGTAPRARVRHRDGGWQEIAVETLADWVTEERNPANERGVAAIEVFLPAATLEDGISLVDTPGLGSVFTSASERTKAFVPHIDVAVLVTGVDPPVSGDELSLLASLAPDVDTVFVVVNKVDRHAPEEIEHAVAFIERVVSERLQSRPHPPRLRVFRVSAAAALHGEPARFEWDALGHALRDVAAASGRSLLRAAAARGVARLRERLRREIAVRREALTRPIAETVARVDALRAMTADVEHRRVVLGHLLAAEEQALHRTLEEWRDRFMAECAGVVEVELDGTLAVIDTGKRGPARRREAMDRARAIAREQLRPWFARVSEAGEAAYRELTARHVSVANEYLGRLLPTIEPDSSGVGDTAFDVDAGFRVRSGFYHTDMMTIGSPVAPGAWTLDLVASPAVTTRRIRRDALAYLHRLLEVNTSRVLGDIRDRVLESRRGLQSDVERFLRGMQEAAERGLARAREARDGGERAVQEELERLDRIAGRLRSMADDSGAD